MTRLRCVQNDRESTTKVRRKARGGETAMLTMNDDVVGLVKATTCCAVRGQGSVRFGGSWNCNFDVGRCAAVLGSRVS